jgi:hypothetical protein
MFSFLQSPGVDLGGSAALAALTLVVLAFASALAALAGSFFGKTAKGIEEAGLPDDEPLFVLPMAIAVLRDAPWRIFSRSGCAQAVVAAAACCAVPFVAGWSTPAVVPFAALVCLCAIACATDIEAGIITEETALAMFFLGLLTSPLPMDYQDAIVASATACFSVWLAMLLVGYAMRADLRAGGDVFVAMAGGAWVGAGHVGLFLLASCLLYIAYAVWFRIRGQVYVQMGPALCAAMLIVAAWAVVERT